MSEYPDTEITAIASISETLTNLEPDIKDRVLRYVVERYQTPKTPRQAYTRRGKAAKSE